MPDSVQRKIAVIDAEALIRFLSRPRFQTYIAAAGHDLDRAWNLYLWNARLGEAFHMPIQAVEVGLRNAIDRVLIRHHGENWGTDPGFASTLQSRAQGDLETVKRRIRERKQRLEHGQIVAGLSFGFWVQLLHRRYNPSIWSHHLDYGFPSLPTSIDLNGLHERALLVNVLRNRISHHEPLIRSDVSRLHSQVVELIGWICPVSRELCRPHFTLPKVMREKP